jgi:hypothetical protein
MKILNYLLFYNSLHKIKYDVSFIMKVTDLQNLQVSFVPEILKQAIYVPSAKL